MPSDRRRAEPRQDSRPGRSKAAARARAYGGFALTIAIGAAAGWLCHRLGVPLPWMVGPLIATAMQSIWLGAPYVPIWMRWSGQLVVASAVALNLTPRTLDAVVSHIWLMFTSALLIILFSFALAALVRRASGVDRATALFASLPGGPLEMAALAEQVGGVGALVAFAQTLRIAGIVTVIPPILIFMGEHFAPVPAAPLGADLPGLALVLGAGLAGSLVFRLFGGVNAFFLGPLIAVGLLTVTVGPPGKVPFEVIALAQVALGLSLGRMFDRSLVLSARSFILYGAMISLILIGLALGLAALFTALGPDSFALYALGNAPGSITEMAVAAKGLNLDASLVTAFHVLRILIIVPFAALFYRAFVRLADWVEARRNPDR